MSLDGIPYIGQYSRNTPDLYVAAGFNKWGMSASMVSAMVLCRKAAERLGLQFKLIINEQQLI